jgi:hypothetical protein
MGGMDAIDREAGRRNVLNMLGIESLLELQHVSHLEHG